SGCAISLRMSVRRDTAKVRNSSNVERNDPGRGSSTLIDIWNIQRQPLIRRQNNSDNQPRYKNLIISAEFSTTGDGVNRVRLRTEQVRKLVNTAKLGKLEDLRPFPESVAQNVLTVV